MASDSFPFSASDGQKLNTYRWLPKGAVRGVVQIAHGMSEHAGRYARFAQALAAQGLAVYAHDHRGHGQTAGGDANLGYVGNDGWNRVVADLHELTVHLRAQHKGVPLVLMGHSMGSFMVQQYLFTWSQDVDAVILSATTGKPPAIAKVGILFARLESLRLGPRGRSTLLDRLSFADFNKQFKNARTPFDWLSRDPAEVDKYIQDPQCGFICSASYWVDFLLGLQWISRAENQARIRKDLPIHLVSGSLDPVSQSTAGVRQLMDAYRVAGLTRVTHTFYPDARHELLNETNREQVTADLLGFIGGQLPAA